MEGPFDPEAKERPMPAPSLKDACYVNAMIHFYRGELGRIMIWRQRLDVTTTWAITSSTTVITVAYSFRDIPHIIFFSTSRSCGSCSGSRLGDTGFTMPFGGGCG